MNKIKNLQELREFILYLENKYDLLDFEIDGVKPWQLMRVQIDYDLGKISGFMDTPHTVLLTKDKIFNILTFFKNSIFNNPFFAKHADIIIFPHARVKEVDNQLIDIYTYYFIEKLLKEKKDFIEIENPYLGRHLKETTSWRFYNDFILVSKNIFANFLTIDKIDINFISQVQDEIKQKIGKYDLYSLFVATVKKYKVEYFLYKKLLEKIKPKQIYLVVSYGGFGSLIKAAKDLNIETIEFQHGNFSKYHFGYYFGENKKQLDYFPDKFYVWNKYWKSLINFPINDENIIINGFDYLKNKKNLYNNIKKEKNKMLVLSQGVLGDKIAEKLIENWEYFKQFNIKYKLHPGEYDRWNNYTSLNKLLKNNNVEIVKDVNLYELFSSCEYQVGVYSTALSEGIEFGCKTIFLNLPGIEEMDTFKKIYGYENCL